MTYQLVKYDTIADFRYGIELEKSGTSDNGYMKCKMAGTYVGKCT